MERSRIQRIEKDLLSLKAGKNNETVQNQSKGREEASLLDYFGGKDRDEDRHERRNERIKVLKLRRKGSNFKTKKTDNESLEKKRRTCEEMSRLTRRRGCNSKER